MARARQVASLFGTLKMEDDQFKKSLADGKSGVLGLSSSLKETGRNVTEFGMKMTGVGMAILAPLGLGVKAATDFEFAFSDVVKTVTATDAELAVLNSTIRDMATNKDNPLSSLDNAHATLAQIMASGGQLGVATKDLAAFTETIGALSVATNLTAEEGATQLAQFANVVKMSADDFDNFAGALVRLGNNSATTEADIMAITSRIASAGNRAGLSEQEILAFGASLTSLGITAELGGTNFSKFINTMTNGVANGGRQLDIFARVSGKSAADFKKAYETDAAGAVTTFLQGLNKLDPAEQSRTLDELGLTGEEVARVVQSLAGNTELLTASLGHAAAGWEDATDHMDEAVAKANTTQGTMNRLQNQLTDLGVEIGNALLPAVNSMMEAISPVITEVSKWISQNPELVAGVAAAAAGLVVLGTVLSGLGMIITGLGAVVAVLTSPITLVIAGVAALALAYHENFGGIRDFVDNEVRPRLEQFFNFLGGVWAVVQPALQSIYDWFVETALPAIVTFVEETVMPAVETFFNFIGGVWDFISSPLNALYDWFTKTGLPAIKDFLEKHVMPRINEFVTTLQNIWTSVQPFLNELKTGFETVMNQIKQIVQPVIDLINGIGQAVQDAIKWVQQLDNQPKVGIDKVLDDPSALNNPGSLFGPGFASGGFTGSGNPNDPAGIVHKEEFVVPRQGALVMREGAAGGDGGGMHFAAGAITINANTYEGGRAAARGFHDELTEMKRRRG